MFLTRACHAVCVARGAWGWGLRSSAARWSWVVADTLFVLIEGNNCQPLGLRRVLLQSLARYPRFVRDEWVSVGCGLKKRSKGFLAKRGGSFGRSLEGFVILNQGEIGSPEGFHFWGKGSFLANASLPGLEYL